jgi:hypothetical protein
MASYNEEFRYLRRSSSIERIVRTRNPQWKWGLDLEDKEDICKTLAKKPVEKDPLVTLKGCKMVIYCDA